MRVNEIFGVNACVRLLVCGFLFFLLFLVFFYCDQSWVLLSIAEFELWTILVWIQYPSLWKELLMNNTLPMPTSLHNTRMQIRFFGVVNVGAFLLPQRHFSLHIAVNNQLFIVLFNNLSVLLRFSKESQIERRSIHFIYFKSLGSQIS